MFLFYKKFIILKETLLTDRREQAQAGQQSTSTGAGRQQDWHKTPRADCPTTIKAKR